MRPLLGVLLVLVAAPAAAQQAPIPKLLDSLVAIMGHAPDSVVTRCYFGKRGRTLGDVVTLCDPRDTVALFHELGHFWSAKENLKSYEVADSLHLNMDRPHGVERIADIYADLLRVRTGRTPNNASAADLLARLLTPEVAPPR